MLLAASVMSADPSSLLLLSLGDDNKGWLSAARSALAGLNREF